jgi:nitrate reductase NapAB chaperone NapD
MIHYFKNGIQNTRFNDSTGELIHVFNGEAQSAIIKSTIESSQIENVLTLLKTYENLDRSEFSSVLLTVKNLITRI